MDSNMQNLIDFQNIDVSNIEGVRFYPNNGKSFSVSLDSLKRIAFFIIDKYEKVKFHPNELKEERDYFVEHFESKLSPDDYKIVVDTLSRWVSDGGRVELISKKSSWMYRSISLIGIWGLYLPCAFVWGALTGMGFDAPGSDQDMSVVLLFLVLNGLPLFGMFWYTWKIIHPKQ